ncbi:ATP-dependent helicase [Brevundimonas subvibrioides]|uniref:ATP-dependent helicase n=1 Tax=Brevundimonas subvibrioides TaxID=74313 RepID=UPI0022B54D6B|nr:ATP-dependent helicase [Brevundimonas subvibrioides]
MDAWRDIRLKARRCHGLALARANGDRRGRALVDAAIKEGDLELKPCDPGERFGDGVYGMFIRDDGLVYVVRGQDPKDEVVVIAHEIGHSQLHHDATTEVRSVQSQLGGDIIDSGAGVVEGHSPRERKEIQADVFAGEFLCPADWLRSRLVGQRRRPSEIAEELGLPYGLVLNQAIRALLLPPLMAPPAAQPGPAVALDDSQQKAATWSGGPLLLDAGPGTGKTRTLVHRIGHVLRAGALPGTFLALTFSNKAAEEMRERLSVSHPDESIEMWVGTFHQFGLELVTKWPSRVGRTANVKILDQTTQLALLEDNLTRLPLRHYQNLYEPAFELVHVLGAISRCKDELLSPEQYLAEAEAALALNPGDEAAEKAVEVGHIYKIYQELLREADAMDFGDLVMLAVQLVTDHDDIRNEYRERFQHILVDEYQDVNLASARLLQVLAGACQDVWVVGDQRQSIYRFRGAEPANVGRFQTDFRGAKLSLTSNYRSGGPVVRAFSAFSRHMAADPGAAANWNAHRGELGEVTLTVADTVAEEAAAIRDQIEALRAAGIAYRDQVILARSHLTLSRITGVLEQLNVPLLYLGDLFERDDIRDLLSLVAIDAEFGGIGLVRLAQLPEYGASKADALVVIQWAEENDATIFDALHRLTEMEGISEAGKTGLSKLAGQLAGFGSATSPWTLVTSWLFERSDYLRPLLESNHPKAQQQLIAIYQLLKVCSEQRDLHGGSALRDPGRKAFLERIRRIEALNQDSRYRAVVSEASDFDAVRVMTIHGSKGLEFRGVHLPALATRYMPSNRQWARCPPPASLAKLVMQKEDHDAEEECLFFVGLSRARDYLCLSRAQRYTQVNASASKFLDTVARHVMVTRFAGPAPQVQPAPVWAPRGRQDSYAERELDIYLRCPARYQYEVVDGLRGGREASPYLRFHRCVYRTMAWLEQQARDGAPASPEQARAELARQWEMHGPVHHGFNGYYRSAADSMVVSIARLIATEAGEYDREPWSVQLEGRVVTYEPDRVVLVADGSVRVQRVRTGRKSKSEAENRIYALLRRGAAQRYPGCRVSVEAYYPATNEAAPMEAGKDDKLLGEYTDAITGIERGEFHPKPDPQRCPGCPCYFICGA